MVNWKFQYQAVIVTKGFNRVVYVYHEQVLAESLKIQLLGTGLEGTDLQNKTLSQ